MTIRDKNFVTGLPVPWLVQRDKGCNAHLRYLGYGQRWVGQQFDRLWQDLRHYGRIAGQHVSVYFVNKLAERRFLRFTTSTSAAYTVTITTTPTPPTNDPPPPPDEVGDQSDPDMVIYRRGEIVAFDNGSGVSAEVFTTRDLPAGTYVADLQEWRWEDEVGASTDIPKQIVFDVFMSPLWMRDDRMNTGN